MLVLESCCRTCLACILVLNCSPQRMMRVAKVFKQRCLERWGEDKIYFDEALTQTVANVFAKVRARDLMLLSTGRQPCQPHLASRSHVIGQNALLRWRHDIPPALLALTRVVLAGQEFTERDVKEGENGSKGRRVELQFLPVSVVQLVEADGRLINIEPYLEGKYVKHNDNNGAIESAETIPQAFRCSPAHAAAGLRRERPLGACDSALRRKLAAGSLHPWTVPAPGSNTGRAPNPCAPKLVGQCPPQLTEPGAASLPPSPPYKVDTSRPSLRTNWTRLQSYERSHFTWESSNHQYLVCDIQGVGRYYTGFSAVPRCLLPELMRAALTYLLHNARAGLMADPQIHSLVDKRMFGIGNISSEGIVRFLRSHRCNSYCRQLKLPPATKSLQDEEALQKEWKKLQNQAKGDSGAGLMPAKVDDLADSGVQRVTTIRSTLQKSRGRYEEAAPQHHDVWCRQNEVVRLQMRQSEQEMLRRKQHQQSVLKALQTKLQNLVADKQREVQQQQQLQHLQKQVQQLKLQQQQEQQQQQQQQRPEQDEVSDALLAAAKSQSIDMMSLAAMDPRKQAEVEQLLQIRQKLSRRLALMQVMAAAALLENSG